MTARAYLDAVRKRCDEATPEPWIAAAPSSFGVDLICCESGDGFVIGDDAPATESDAEFIANARTDLPKLERIASLAEDYREAVRKSNYESISADETRCALFEALEKLT